MQDPGSAPDPGDPLPAADARAARLLGRAFLGLVALVFGLIVLGALVRANGAGLSCPDWPLCFGRVIPRFNLKVAFEYTHRVVAGTVTLAFLGLGIGLLARPATRRLGRPLWLVAALLLVAQVVLGALTVWHLLASWTVTAHLATGNTFNACLLLLGLRLREAGEGEAPSPSGVSPWARILTTLALVLLAFQIILGGLVSSTHAGLACTEWPACNSGVFFPTWQGPVGLHLMHRTNGYLLLLVLGLTAVVTRPAPRLGRLMAIAAGTAVAQVCVGIANVLLRLPIEVTALHSALAAALVLLLVASAREAWRDTPLGRRLCYTARPDTGSAA